jgi:hypothetical protein
MTEQIKCFSDADLFELLQKAQESYDEYLKLPIPEVREEVMPTYSTANPVGLAVYVVVD